MDYTHVLWDFNGTIIDDVDVGIRSANVLLSRRGLKTIGGIVAYRDVFCFPIVDYYANIGLDLERERFADLAVEWMDLYVELIRGADICPGVMDAFEKFKDEGIRQVVLSATEKNMLDGQLEELGISGYFEETLGLDNIHAHSKEGIAREWMDANPGAKVLLIGDTVHDCEVARSTGMDCVLMATGHQSRERLSECGVPVFENAHELLEDLFPG